MWFTLALWHHSQYHTGNPDTAPGPNESCAARAGCRKAGVALGVDALGTQETTTSRGGISASRGVGPVRC